MAVNLTSLSNEELKTFISSFDTVLTDCDGMYVIVVWFALFVLPFSHICNIRHVNYNLQHIL
jgi:hypothetical protein